MTAATNPLEFTAAQIERLRADPPETHTRRAPGNRTVDYIPIHLARQLANEIFGEHAWSEEAVSEAILSERVYKKRDRDGNETSVFRVVARHTLKLTVLTPGGGGIVRTGIGIGSAEAPAEGDVSPAFQAIKIAKANALTNALKTFGRAFGNRLNPPENPLPNARRAPASASARTASPRQDITPKRNPVPAAAAVPASPSAAPITPPIRTPAAGEPQKPAPQPGESTDLKTLCGGIKTEILAARDATARAAVMAKRQPDLNNIAKQNPGYYDHLATTSQNHAADLQFFGNLKAQAETIPDLASWRAIGQMYQARLDVVKGRNPAFHAEIIQWCRSRDAQLADADAA